MRQTPQISVLVCEPQPLVREGLLAVLDQAPDLTAVGSAIDVADALAVAEQEHPQVVVVAHDPPVINGIELARKLSEADTQTGVLLLVAESRDDELLIALQASIHALLPRDTAPTALVSAVRFVASGAVVLAARTAVRLLTRMAHGFPSTLVQRPDLMSVLTRRELDVLLLVARGHSNRRIAEELWLSEATVKSHLYHLSRKLNLQDRTQAVILAYETGLIRPSPQ